MLQIPPGTRKSPGHPPQIPRKSPLHPLWLGTTEGPVGTIAELSWVLSGLSADAYPLCGRAAYPLCGRVPALRTRCVPALRTRTRSADALRTHSADTLPTTT